FSRLPSVDERRELANQYIPRSHPDAGLARRVAGILRRVERGPVSRRTKSQKRSQESPSSFCARRAQNGRRPQESLNSEPFLHCRNPVARDGNLGALLILEPEEHLSAEPGVQLVYEGDIDQRGAMHSYEAPRLEFRFEFLNRMIDDVVL